MKLITAVIKPHKLEDTREALTKLNISGMMISEIKGFGRQAGHTEIYRGAEYQINYLPKVRIDLVVNDHQVEDICNTIRDTANTGKIGDGKLFVINVESAMRIRTGETNEDAI